MGKFEKYGSLETRAIKNGRGIDEQWIAENESREITYKKNDDNGDKEHKNAQEQIAKLKAILREIERSQEEEEKHDKFENQMNLLIDFIKNKERETKNNYSELIQKVEMFRTKALNSMDRHPKKIDYILSQSRLFDEKVRKHIIDIEAFITTATKYRDEVVKKVYLDLIASIKEEISIPNKQELIVFVEKFFYDFLNIDFKQHKDDNAEKYISFVNKFQIFCDLFLKMVDIFEELDKIVINNPVMGSTVSDIKKEISIRVMNLQPVDINEYKKRIEQLSKKEFNQKDDKTTTYNDSSSTKHPKK